MQKEHWWDGPPHNWVKILLVLLPGDPGKNILRSEIAHSGQTLVIAVAIYEFLSLFKRWMRRRRVWFAFDAWLWVRLLRKSNIGASVGFLRSPLT